jgi:hypothetical protein
MCPMLIDNLPSVFSQLTVYYNAGPIKCQTANVENFEGYFLLIKCPVINVGLIECQYLSDGPIADHRTKLQVP